MIDFRLDAEARVIHCTTGGVLATREIADYFQRLVAALPAGSEYLEDVDFRGVERFDDGFVAFLGSKKGYAELIQSRRIRGTRFTVGNAYQYGMARMYVGLLEAFGGSLEIVSAQD